MSHDFSDALWLYAHPSEAEGLAIPRSHCIGVGKVAAAVACTRALIELRPPLVVNFGVAGAYLGGPAVGAVCLVAREFLADEGAEQEDGFRSLDAMGLGSVGPFLADEPATSELSRRLGGVPRVDGATVSSCSATDARGQEVAGRTGAAVESMEGAAVAMAASACGVPWVQLRAVSNRTGDRAKAGWDLDRARTALHHAVHRVLA